MPYRIVFLDCTSKPYNGKTHVLKPLGGIQSCTVSLAEAFAHLGHDVFVMNQCEDASIHNGVIWLPMSADVPDADIVIANNDPRLFDRAVRVIEGGARSYLWLHNSFGLIKTLKKKRMGALFRYSPKAVFLGGDQMQKAGLLYPFRARTIMHHGLRGDFLNLRMPDIHQRRNRAVFFSQPYRGLKEVAALWRANIHPYHKDAELYVYGDRTAHDAMGLSDKLLEQSGIIVRPRMSKDLLIEELLQAKLMLYFGHKDETFCLAAAEAMACGLPVVTRGIGSLAERVDDGVNGIVHRNGDVLAQGILTLFSDDDQWMQFSSHAYQGVQNLSWVKQAQRWEVHVFDD